MRAEIIAKVCHEVNKAYCEGIGDYSQLPWDEAPEWQRESCIKGAKFAMTMGTDPEDLHINWYNHKLKDGWIYGEVKDIEKKEHPCMVRYNQLPKEQALKDKLFGAVIKGLS